jgi:hypothetical protein
MPGRASLPIRPHLLGIERAATHDRAPHVTEVQLDEFAVAA